MRGEFTEYLDSIGVTRTAKKQIRTIHDFYQIVCPEEITGIFVTDFVNEEGTREYENLWFFSETLIMEAKNFLSTDEFDMVPLTKTIARWEVKRHDYDFEAATERSRLSLSFTLGQSGLGVQANLKASGENCDYLKHILITYVIPNLEGERVANSGQ